MACGTGRLGAFPPPGRGMQRVACPRMGKQAQVWRSLGVDGCDRSNSGTLARRMERFSNIHTPLVRWDLTLAVNQESVAASAVLALVLNDHLVRLGELGGRGRRQRGVLERREGATVDAARAVLGDRLG